MSEKGLSQIQGPVPWWVGMTFGAILMQGVPLGPSGRSVVHAGP